MANPSSEVDSRADTGAGGELHQVAGGNHPVMTTNQGIPVSDDQNSLSIGPRGPVLLEDFILREKITHFDHERIPERVVHARGSAAHGYFETTASLSDITVADIFQRPGERTPVFVRFSTVAGSKGSMDLARDVRGFAVKFYTKEGNWDLVGNNIPVFFIQDAIKFPDVVHAVKDEPDRGFPQAQSAHDTFWDFISLTPESMHMVMWQMSDRTIPRSFRMMEGFGVHTFRLVNPQGKSTFVKFHWRPKLGSQSVIWDEALKINGADPDFHRRDLWEAIEAGDYPEWELGLQLFDDAYAEKFDFDVLDPTKIIPEEEVPLRIVGRLVLDRNPDNFFAETEQVAFCTADVVPGIDFSDDPLLQGRNFSYLDTQLKRLGGPNFTQIPINAPRCPVHNFQRDGHMQMQVPKGRVNYEPNSLSADGPREDRKRGFTSFPADGAGATAAGPLRDFCRPLQPGAAVLLQPDQARAGPHRRRPHLRAEQGRDGRGAGEDAGPARQHRRFAMRAGRRRPRLSRTDRADRARRPRPHRPQALPGNQHPRQGGQDGERPAHRLPGIGGRRRGVGREPASSREGGGWAVQADRPDARRRHGEQRQADPGRLPTRGRTVRAV